MAHNFETKEPQYSLLFDVVRKWGVSRFGLMANESWNNDPKRTLFTLARYKFVAKMLAGKKDALEIGCADAFGTRLVQQTVSEVHVIDFDQVFIDDVISRQSEKWPLVCRVHDILAGPYPGRLFQSAFMLDVLEHISPENEEQLFSNITSSLEPEGVLIVGSPSLESQFYASPQSRAGHCNCKSGEAFKRTLESHFKNVFVFSMNDEVVHTGFFPMAHYLIGLCVSPK